jgi:hypothetical protein
VEEYVQYHGPEHAEFPDETAGSFSIYTRKNVDGILGSRIWLIARKPSTDEYYLAYWFIADAVVQSQSGEPDSVTGVRGAWLRPPLRIDALPWFSKLRKHLGNFGFGLSRIAEPALASRDSGCRRCWGQHA